MTERLRRSFLYTPADDRSMMEKSATLPTDAVVFDLEDAIPDAAVPEARDRIASVVEDVDFGSTEVCVRINGYRSRLWLHDLLAAVEADVDLVLLPMIESVQQLETMVTVAEQAADTDALPEFAMIVETPRGLFEAHTIADRARSLPQVTGLSFGFGDYTRTVGATGRPDRIREFISHMAVGAASIGGLEPIATVYQDFSDSEGLRRAAERAREIGYVGQKAIHPAQLEVINDVYTPTEEEVEQARHFVETFEESSRNSIVVDGVFLDTAIVDQYRTILDRDEAIRS